jgi:hypothetical protein
MNIAGTTMIIFPCIVIGNTCCKYRLVWENAIQKSVGPYLKL